MPGREAVTDFEWQPTLERIQQDCLAEGIRFEVQGREKLGTAVKKVFLKTDSNRADARSELALRPEFVQEDRDQAGSEYQPAGGRFLRVEIHHLSGDRRRDGDGLQIRLVTPARTASRSAPSKERKEGFHKSRPT